MSGHLHERAAVQIIEWLHRAERDLIGRVAATFAGETGTISTVTVSQEHGLCFGFEGRPERWPVSTIKHRARDV
ncbi:MAG: hypothetical protein ABIO35_10620 [Nitrobacter sp.]